MTKINNITTLLTANHYLVILENNNEGTTQDRKVEIWVKKIPLPIGNVPHETELIPSYLHLSFLVLTSKKLLEKRNALFETNGLRNTVNDIKVKITTIGEYMQCSTPKPINSTCHCFSTRKQLIKKDPQMQNLLSACLTAPTFINDKYLTNE